MPVQPRHVGEGPSAIRRRQSILTVLPPKLIHQASELGGQLGFFRAKVLLQPFADATAYRSAGGAIDLFAALIDSVGHRGFHFALVAVR
jgi:hypothetical protein